MKLLMLFTAALTASQAFAWENPSSAITQFLEFELGGGRLSGERWIEYTTNYIAAPEEYDEPGWDEATIVETHQLMGIKCPSPSRCEATVEFNLFPTANIQGPHVTPHPIGGKQVNIYSIVRQGNSWLIEPGFGIPIISIQTYVRHKAENGL